ncbi:MAG: hypothetical protein NC489_46120 [Ruminococcus flavefaciens]|nr:hypothetical protein [Ruminococcus flavefaciens]
MGRSYVIDVSGYQPNARNVSFWQSAKAKNVLGAIVKTSESTYYQNPYGWAQVSAAKQVGIKVSGYHFARFVGNGSQARAEANYAIATANSMGIPHGNPLVLDYELRMGYQSSNTLAAITFCQVVKNAGFVPVFYSYSGMSNLWDYEAVYRATGAKMWIAAYPHSGATYSPDYNYFPSISTHTDAWQFTDDLFGWGVDGSVDLTGVFTNMVETKITSGGNLDSLKFDNDKLQVSGWFASDKAKDKQYAYVILTNESISKEYGRAKVNLSDRPDVSKVYPDIPNANKSGFSASLEYTKEMKGQRIRVIFRYTDDPAGNGNAVDYSAMADLNKSAANLDSVATIVYSNKLQVSGWFATDLALGLDKTFLILYDTDNKKELERIKYIPSKRPDVQKVNPAIYNSELSGFSGKFNYSSLLIGRNLQVIARYSDDENGEGNHVDYWFDPIKGPNMPVLDGKTETEITVHEFSASQAKDGLIDLKFK